MSMTETVKYLDNLDSAVTKANEALHNTVMTSAGKINQNPNLDGFKQQIREVSKHFPQYFYIKLNFYLETSFPLAENASFITSSTVTRLKSPLTVCFKQLAAFANSTVF